MTKLVRIQFDISTFNLRCIIHNYGLQLSSKNIKQYFNRGSRSPKSDCELVCND